MTAFSSFYYFLYFCPPYHPELILSLGHKEGHQKVVYYTAFFFLEAVSPEHVFRHKALLAEFVSTADLAKIRMDSAEAPGM